MDEQGGAIHEVEQRIRFHDCGPDLKLSVVAALRFFEEIALLQSEALGYGFTYYHEHHVGWLLSRWDLEFHGSPPFDETVLVRTQPRECGKLSANRAFELIGADGSICIEGLSQWIFVDMARQRPARIPVDLAAAYGMVPQRAPPPFRSELLAPVTEDCAVELEVRRGDIDLNGHVNNVCYVEWALSSLPGDFGERQLTGLRAHFQKETTFGESVHVAAAVESGPERTTVRHAVTVGDRTACLLTTEWLDQRSDCR